MPDLIVKVLSKSIVKFLKYMQTTNANLIKKTNDFAKIREIRIKIFNKELSLSNEDIFDEDDKTLEQFLIIHGEKTVGTFRLRSVNDSYKIERMGFFQSIVYMDMVSWLSKKS